MGKTFRSNDGLSNRWDDDYNDNSTYWNNCDRKARAKDQSKARRATKRVMEVQERHSDVEDGYRAKAY